MDDWLIWMLNALSQGPTGPLESLTQSPAEYNESLYNAAVAIHNGAVKPVTAVVLSIVLVMMLAQASTKIDGDRELGVRIISGILLKSALVIVFASNALTVLGGIDDITTTIAQSALDTDVGGGDGNLKIGDSLRDDIEDAGTPEKLLVFAVIMLPFFAAIFAGIMAIVLIYVRFLQLHLLTVFGSLPIARPTRESPRMSTACAAMSAPRFGS